MKAKVTKEQIKTAKLVILFHTPTRSTSFMALAEKSLSHKPAVFCLFFFFFLYGGSVCYRLPIRECDVWLIDAIEAMDHRRTQIVMEVRNADPPAHAAGCELNC
jgi:hypothetical protein